MDGSDARFVATVGDASLINGRGEPVFAPNDRPWCGDHVSAPAEAVPGVCLASFPLPAAALQLRDFAPSVLRYFGLSVPSSLSGSSNMLDSARR